MEEFEKEEPFFGPRLFDNPKYNMVEEEDIDMEGEYDGTYNNSDGQQSDSEEEEEYELEDTCQEQHVVVPTPVPIIENEAAANEAVQYENTYPPKNTHYSGAQMNGIYTEASTNEVPTQLDDNAFTSIHTL